ncbi:histidine kinase [Brachybacterium muris]|uniref:sensor histidine kinase n=1 Tax=Brachybacterium muris TaxID=219301 RepID=UPI0021E420BD|nr:histidine kinase [Brachybacterium muris]
MIPNRVGLLLFTVMTGLIPLHLTLKWWTALISAAAVVALAVLVGIPLAIAAPLGSFMLALVLVLRSSLWLLDLVDQIEKVRQVEGKLALAEERLRFSRDLHDVMGRDLSSIAVTAELVTQLAERGDPRAAEHARSISAMARSSLADVRALVRGYREVDLPPELQGTLSLLRSAGISTHVHGEADDVPAEHAEAATWALREAGTNLLRHADATTVRITLGPDGMRVVNDGATPPASAAPTAIVEGSGLRGLRERLGPTRTLRTEQDGDTFTLDIRFTPEENHDQS